jgi:hypothetical protein
MPWFIIYSLYGLHFQHRNRGTLPAESVAHDSGRNLVRAEYGHPKGSPKHQQTNKLHGS